ncbi:MAG: cytidylate kinase family protein [Sphaerochaeta sp.]|jgi:cytidylate kinase|nr:cytidylate kinase-like family protein [Sphaerochaeta sp.]MDX9915673.1 cytidylate kinase family protein [Sphaerochaeta sp.]
MGVITISRQIGSSGTFIAEEVAKRLDLVVIEKEDIEAIMHEYGFSAFGEVYDTVPSFWDRYDEHRALTVDFLLAAMRAFAKVDNVVLLGRGGFSLFQGFTDVLNVRTKAPLAVRLMRKQGEYGSTDKECKRILERAEEVRTAFVKSDLHCNQDDASLFDLVIDTGIVEPVEAASIISAAYVHLMKHPRIDATHTRADLEVDEILLKLVSGHVAKKRQ